jgi:hypothetical protein
MLHYFILPYFLFYQFMFHIYAISFFLAFKLYSLVAKKKQIALTARPTAPSPNTATVVPSFTLAVFHAAPTPIYIYIQ